MDANTRATTYQVAENLLREFGRYHLADSMNRVCDDHEPLTVARSGQRRGTLRSRPMGNTRALTAIVVADQASAATNPFQPVAM